jgi:hypothetical protein
MGSSRQDGFHPLGEISPFQKYPVPASFALDADIRPQSHHFPFLAPAGMGLPQLYDIAQGKIGQHAIIITTARAN